MRQTNTKGRRKKKRRKRKKGKGGGVVVVGDGSGVVVRVGGVFETILLPILNPLTVPRSIDVH